MFFKWELLLEKLPFDALPLLLDLPVVVKATCWGSRDMEGIPTHALVRGRLRLKTLHVPLLVS